jgi:hypothetical protein
VWPSLSLSCGGGGVFCADRPPDLMYCGWGVGGPLLCFEPRPLATVLPLVCVGQPSFDGSDSYLFAVGFDLADPLPGDDGAGGPALGLPFVTRSRNAPSEDFPPEFWDLGAPPLATTDKGLSVEPPALPGVAPPALDPVPPARVVPPVPPAPLPVSGREPRPARATARAAEAPAPKAAAVKSSSSSALHKLMNAAVGSADAAGSPAAAGSSAGGGGGAGVGSVGKGWGGASAGSVEEEGDEEDEKEKRLRK